MYIDETGKPFAAAPGELGSSCTVDITTYEPVDGLVEGTFTAVVRELGGFEFRTISGGTFSVVRQPDS